MRIASLLPSATEIVAALGLRDSLVGVTHECDYPAGVERLPHLTSNLLSSDLSSHAIDTAVRSSLKEDAHTIYGLEADLLRELAPDVILTQALCEVCAVPTNMVEDAVCTMPQDARIVSLDPMGLDAVFTSIEQAGDALGVADRGRSVAARLRAQIDAISDAVSGAPRPRLLAAEWLDPVYCGGHWVPEMIEIAGGTDCFGNAGEASRRLAWGDVIAADPDVIVLMPCGFFAHEIVERYGEIAAAPEFRGLRAVRQANIYAVDATSYYSRPGPRLVEGTRILARILHPDRVAGPLPDGVAFKLREDGAFEQFV
jgi:iron complex transport system substrate-binding protein